MKRSVVSLTLALSLVLAPACRDRSPPLAAAQAPEAPAHGASAPIRPEPAPVALVAPPAPAPPPPPARVEPLPVPHDLPASLVRSLDGAAPTTVFLPGLCSNAGAYLQSFPEAARHQGGVLAVDGDAPCVPGFHSFSWDAGKLHARIEAAMHAAGLTEDPPGGLTLVGYSQGAALAEQLIQRWPSRYARVILIGAPTDPSALKLATARAVVTMSCSRDVPGRMKQATTRLLRAGIPSTYVEMPKCTHGNIAAGEESFDLAFAFLRDSARPSP